MSKRKLWSTTFPQLASKRTRHESKAAAYRYVRNRAANFHVLRSSIIDVYVDDRGGQGWRLYERIDLRQLPDWE